jgi:DNA invertase Pin-like site-specific DNA recombinase
MRIAIYSRVSTKKQDEMNQLLQLREFVARQNGWIIEAEYVDKVSGSGKKERKAFDQMLMDASQKKFDLLLFWALDRLSREGIVKTIGYLEQLKGWNVGWRSYTQPFLDTGNDMVTGIVLSVLRETRDRREHASRCARRRLCSEENGQRQARRCGLEPSGAISALARSFRSSLLPCLHLRPSRSLREAEFQCTGYCLRTTSILNVLVCPVRKSMMQNASGLGAG